MRTAEVAVQAALRRLVNANPSRQSGDQPNGFLARLPGGSDGGRRPRARRSDGRLAAMILRLQVPSHG